jgi:hypothetical protein
MSWTANSLGLLAPSPPANHSTEPANLTLTRPDP